MTNGITPAAIFYVGALLVPIFKNRWKNGFLLLIPVVGFFYLLNAQKGSQAMISFLGYELILFEVDRLSLLFGYIFHLISFLGILYSLHLKDDLQQIAGLMYAGSAIGAVFAGDFFSFFVFWEMLTVTSIFLIWQRKTNLAIASGYRYLLVHAAGGLILLAGILLRIHQTGDISFGYIGLSDLSSYLIFLGFGINCAWPILHPWLTDAYPEATITGTVLLSAFTTKTAVYALARAYPGTEALIWIGAAMTAFPIFYAVIENDLRRVLSYSLINQVGFMVCGIGIGTQLALNGAIAHAFNDILFKGLLFMTMGAVMYRTGKIKATDLGGLYKTMPLTCLFCIVGAASISAFPFFSGFVSKSMVMSAAGNGHMAIVWFILLFASAGVFHHAGIKIPYFAFFSHDSGLRPREAPWNMLLAMGITAFLCIFIGTFPGPLYSLLPYQVPYEPYTGSHVLSQSQLLFFSALAFTLLILAGIYPSELRCINLDSDWFYRKGGRLIFFLLDKGFNRLNGLCEKIVMSVARSLADFFRDAVGKVFLFFLVNIWLITGQSGIKLEIKKNSLYNDIRQGSLPIGIGAMMAVIFVVFVFLLH